MDQLLDSLYRHIRRAVVSDRFFRVTVVLAVAQALWYALSFEPGLFDEIKHLSRIYIFTDNPSPFFMGEQDPSWDHAGVVARSPYYFYYTLLSWPLRIIRWFISDPTIEIILLRLINIGFFATGLVVMRRAFLQVKQIPKSVAHLSLLILVVTPALAPLAGAVNYDNLVFLLFAVLLLYTVKILNDKKLRYINVAGMTIAALAMVMTKWTSAALFAPIVIFVLLYLVRTHGKKLWPQLILSFKKTPRKLAIGSLGLMILFGVLVLERHIVNVAQYGHFHVSCTKALSYERCLAFHDFQVYQWVIAGIPVDFEPVSLPDYALMFWIPRTISTQTTLLPWEATQLSPSIVPMHLLYTTMSLAGAALILIQLKQLLRDKVMSLLLFTATGYMVILVIFLYGNYVRYAVPAAVTGRYLQPILPVLAAVAMVAALQLCRGRRQYLAVGLIVFALLFTQGGGILSHSLTAPPDSYRSNQSIMRVNNKMRAVFEKIVVHDEPR